MPCPFWTCGRFGSMSVPTAFTPQVVIQKPFSRRPEHPALSSKCCYHRGLSDSTRVVVLPSLRAPRHGLLVCKHGGGTGKEEIDVARAARFWIQGLPFCGFLVSSGLRDGIYCFGAPSLSEMALISVGKAVLMLLQASSPQILSKSDLGMGCSPLPSSVA